jgi:hypothetical protein
VRAKDAPVKSDRTEVPCLPPHPPQNLGKDHSYTSQTLTSHTMSPRAPPYQVTDPESHSPTSYRRHYTHPRRFCSQFRHKLERRTRRVEVSSWPNNQGPTAAPWRSRASRFVWVATSAFGINHGQDHGTKVMTCSQARRFVMWHTATEKRGRRKQTDKSSLVHRGIPGHHLCTLLTPPTLAGFRSAVRGHPGSLKFLGSSSEQSFMGELVHALSNHPLHTAAQHG